MLSTYRKFWYVFPWNALKRFPRNFHVSEIIWRNYFTGFISNSSKGTRCYEDFTLGHTGLMFRKESGAIGVELFLCLCLKDSSIACRRVGRNNSPWKTMENERWPFWLNWWRAWKYLCFKQVTQMAALGIFNLLSGNLYLQRKTEVYRNLRVIQWYEKKQIHSFSI